MSTHAPTQRARAWRLRELGETSLRMIALAGREGGLTIAEANTIFTTLQHPQKRLRNLSDRGHLFRVPEGGRAARYFATQEAADAWGPPKEPQKPVEVPQTDWGCGFAAVGIGRDVRTGRAWGA